MTETFREKLNRQAELLGLRLTAVQQEQLFLYYERLTEKNRMMNLTAITEEGEVVTKHFIDSMAIVRANVSRETFTVEALAGKHLIDIGTGAGFPGLVLKIVFPALQVLLSDSLKKRLFFLDELIQELGLQGVETVHGRAEDLAHERRFREHFDFAVSRAVANLSTLSEYDLPFVKQGGLFLAMKAGNIREEAEQAEKAIRILGGELEEIVEYTLPETDIERSLLLIRKKKSCPASYPRKAGTPGRNPL